MAPSTRLQAMPGRRVNYAESSAPSGTRASLLRINDTAELRSSPEHSQVHSPVSPETVRNAIRPQQPSLSDPLRPVSNRVTRVKNGAVVKPAGKTPRPKKKARPTKQECSICTVTKLTTRNFKASDEACEHFQTICNLCIQKMLKTKVAERQLDRAELGCPFGNCEYKLGYPALKAMLNKPAFDTYDLAVTKYVLSASESYVTCLSSKCGLQFSVEDCHKEKGSRNSITCPYCEYEICLKCNRPWNSHRGGGCDEAKKAEDAESIATVKKMGAKPCPQCGMNIEKFGGCDHMKCQNCRHNFCWVCLIEYEAVMEHLPSCPHRSLPIANNPGNWIPPNLDDNQINAIIARADEGRNNLPPRMVVPPPANPVQAFDGILEGGHWQMW